MTTKILLKFNIIKYQNSNSRELIILEEPIPIDLRVGCYKKNSVVF